MFSVPDIIVSNNTAFNGNLYPSRIFEWKISGINCAAEDYTIGGTNTWTVSFKTDVKIDTSATLTVSGYSMTITQNARVDDSKNFYTITAVPEKTFELDEFLDDAFTEYDQPETLSHLMGRLGWVNSETGLPYDYVINSKWASQGMTKRQVIGFICQLLGANMSSWMVATPTLFTLNNPNSTVKQYTPSNVKKITITDYSAPGIDKIWFGTDGTDVGIAYGVGTQQLTLPYNPLIDPDSADNTALLQYIYSKVSGNSYHPVKLNTFLDEAPSFSELTGYITVPTISYTDEDNNTYAFPIFNWEVSQGGCSLEANGNADRSVANQVLSSEIAQNGKYNKFKRTLDSTVSEIANLQGDVSSLQQTAAGLTVQVANKVGDDEIISKINQTAETITINANRINMTGYVQFNDLSTSGNTSINGDNLVTGIIKDTQNKNSWNLNTGAFTLTDGSVNIHTSDESQDIIQFSGDSRNAQGYGSVGSAQMRPIGFSLVGDFYTPASHRRYSSSMNGNQGGLFAQEELFSRQDPTQVAGKSYTYYSAGGSGTYSGSGIGVTPTLRAARYTSGDYFYDASDNQVLTVDATNRRFTVGGTNGQIRTVLDESGLTFKNSSGVQTGFYPSSGMDFTVEQKTTSSAIGVLSVGASGSFNINVAKSGYTALGIVGITGSGTTGMVWNDWYLSSATNAKIWYYCAKATTLSSVTVYVLYKKN